MGGADWNVTLEVGLFFFAIWGLGRLFQTIKMPPILGWLAAGIILGPRTLDMVPYASTGLCDSVIRDYNLTDDDSYGKNYTSATTDYTKGRRLAPGGDGSAAVDAFLDYAFDYPETCTWSWWNRHYIGYHTSNIWTWMGNIGVTLMIMESGMHISFEKVKEVGRKSLVVAIAGTGLPLALGVVVVGGLFSGVSDLAFYPWGFSAGCAFAPTSVGIAIKLLHESKMLNTISGQTILTSAFIDDVFSLVTLVILTSLSEGDITATNIVVPTVCSFAFLGAGILFALFLFPLIPKLLLRRITLQKNVSFQLRDEVHLFLMFGTLAFFGWVSSIKKINGVSFIGSPLLGAFVAGMSWVNVPRSHAIWSAQMKRIIKWLMRIFFAASVGFAVPVNVMFTGDAVWRGLVLGVGPCITTKLFAGVFAHISYKNDESKALAQKASWATRIAQPQQLLVGIAMVARGEFAYLVAEVAQNLPYPPGGPDANMLGKEPYAAVVWALVMATIVSPVMFRWALGVFDRATPVHRSAYIGGEGAEHKRRAFVVRIAGKYSPGVQREIFDTLHQAGVDVLDAHLASVRAGDDPDSPIEAFAYDFTVLSRGAKKDFDDEKLQEIHHHLVEVLDDADAQIIFEPANEDYTSDGLLEVQIIGEHHPAVLHEITDKLSDLGLDVIKAMVHQTRQPDHHGHGTRNSNAAPAAAPASAPPVTAAIKVEPAQSKGWMPKPLTALRRQSSNLGQVKTLHTSTGRRSFRGGAKGEKGTAPSLSIEVSEKSNNGNSEPSGHSTAHTHQVGRETFYARESNGSHTTNAKRRHEISDALQKVLHEHHLHGEVLVRLLHESEMALVRTVPKFSKQSAGKISVVRCMGKHHKELLHEINDQLFSSQFDVIHADMDSTDADHETHLFYIQLTDGSVASQEQLSILQDSIDKLYRSHSISGSVVIEPPMGATSADDAPRDAAVRRASLSPLSPRI